MPDTNYSIEARSLGKVGVASHDLWVLRNHDRKALAELHGLATEGATDTPKAIGTDEQKFSLGVWHMNAEKGFADELGESLSRFTYLSDHQQHMIILSVEKEEVLAR